MRRLVLACAALACLAACASDPEPIEPKAGTSRAPNPSAAPTSTLTPPTLPKVAQRSDATGAANFVLYWVKVSNYAALTGDTDLLRSISAPDCEGCNRYIDLYERTYAAGGYFKGGDRTLKKVTATTDGADTYISGELIAAKGRFKISSKSKERRSQQEHTSVTFLVNNSNRKWTMADVGLDL